MLYKILIIEEMKNKHMYTLRNTIRAAKVLYLTLFFLKEHTNCVLMLI